MTWLDDERALADELADTHDLSALRARVTEEDAVVITFPKQDPKPRVLLLAVSLAAAASVGLVVGLSWQRPPDAPEAASIIDVPPPVVPPLEGYLSVITTPRSTVRIDGHLYGETPLVDVQLTPGKHTLDLRTRSRRVTKVVSIDSGQRQAVTYDLPLRVPPKRRGELKIFTMPWAHVLIDGEPAGATPAIKTLEPGKYAVTLTWPDGARETHAVDVKAGKTSSLKARQAKKSSQTSAEKPTK